MKWLPAWWTLWFPWWPPAEFNNVSMLCAFLVFTNCFLFLYHCCILSGIKLTTTTKYAERSDVICLYMQRFVDSSNTVLFWPWWRHQMDTVSLLLAIFAGIHQSPVNSLYKGQWRGAFMFSLLRLNIPLSKKLWGWWFETLSRPLWRQCNV